MKRILTYSLISVFVLLHITDLITTIISYYIKPNFNEINPIYLFLGNIWVSLFIAKMLVILAAFVYFKLLKSKSEIVRYAVVLTIILGCLLTYVAVNNNIKVIKNPEISIEVTESIQVYAAKMNVTETEVKAEIYKEQYSNPFIKSLTIILLIFLVYLRVKKEND